MSDHLRFDRAMGELTDVYESNRRALDQQRTETQDLRNNMQQLEIQNENLVREKKEALKEGEAIKEQLQKSVREETSLRLSLSQAAADSEEQQRRHKNCQSEWEKKLSQLKESLAIETQKLSTKDGELTVQKELLAMKIKDAHSSSLSLTKSKEELTKKIEDLQLRLDYKHREYDSLLVGRIQTTKLLEEANLRVTKLGQENDEVRSLLAGVRSEKQNLVLQHNELIEELEEADSAVGDLTRRHSLAVESAQGFHDKYSELKIKYRELKTSLATKELALEQFSEATSVFSDDDGNDNTDDNTEENNSLLSPNRRSRRLTLMKLPHNSPTTAASDRPVRSVIVKGAADAEVNAIRTKATASLRKSKKKD